MIRKNTLTQLLGLSVLAIASSSTAYAAATNFNCPLPAQIQPTDFTAPTVWIAPPVPHSAKDSVGVGLGGSKVKEFIGSEAAEVNHKKGWVCVYKSADGYSVNEYQSKIRQLAISNPYLKKYLAKVDKAYEDAEPYLKNYPKDIPLGVVGYQAEEQETVKK
jgi:hypothetical protein